MASKIENIPQYVDGLFSRAQKAQKEIEFYTQEQVDRLCRAIVYEVTRPEHVDKIGRLAFEESGMGDLASKFGKMTKKPRGVLWDIRGIKSVGVIEDYPEKGIQKVAKPVGVIGALIPSTQPEATPVVKAMFAIKCRNAIVMSPHPKTQATTQLACSYMRAALKRCGAPEDLVVCAKDPDIPMSKLIMEKADLVIATGGAGMVKAAYSSGTPAYGVGVGNSNVVVDETADLADAAKKLVMSKLTDLSSGCSCENSVIVQESVYDDFIGAMVAEGAYLAGADEKAKLQKALWPNFPADHSLNRDVIVHPAREIAAVAGIDMPANRSVILVEETGSGPDYPFSGEKLSVILTVYKYKTIDDAIGIINANQAYQGAGHSCGIYTQNEDNITAVMLKTKTTRVMVNQPLGVANAGTWNNGMPWTLTLGCGTWGGNIASENITVKHFMNTTWVSRPIEEYIPTDEELFGDMMQ